MARDKMIFLVTEDWYFWSHRLPMARAAREAGFEVAVATRVAAHGERIRGEGFALHPLRWRRRSIGPVASVAAIFEIWRLYRRERPLIVHHVALKAALLGGIAARLARVPGVVSMIAGAGYLASAAGSGARVLGWCARQLWPHLLLRRGNIVIVQNEEDRRDLAALRPDAARRGASFPARASISIISAGAAPPPEPVVFAYAGRMIAIKGVATLVAAHQMLRQRGSDARLVLAGAPDPENPSAIAEATLKEWGALPGIEWRGAVADIRPVWAGAHVAVLASRGGEGLPKALLEAAAMGQLPIVATDVPGTRTIARAGENALLVPPDDPDALAAAMAAMAGDAGLRARCGAASRGIVEAGFSDAAIGAATAAVYRALAAEIGAGPGNSAAMRPRRR